MTTNGKSPSRPKKSPGLIPPTADQDRLEGLEKRVDSLERLLAKILAQQAAPAIQKQLEEQIRAGLSAGEAVEQPG